MSEYKAISNFDYTVQFFDCDYKGRMKYSAILRICAEVAGYDYTLKGFSHSALMEMNMAFLTSKASIHINKHPISKTIVNVSTWECGKKGAIFLRGIYIKDKETGEILVECTTGWILVNPQTRHIYRPSEFKYDMPQVMDKIVNAEKIGKINCGELIKVGEWIPQTTDIDENGHVYNGVYGDIASNILSKEEFEENYSDAKVNFISEVTIGQIMDLYRGDIDGRIVIVGKIEEKICFEFEFFQS